MKQKKKKESFYRPYKGLKLSTIFCPISIKVSCFYRPYKGLKLKTYKETGDYNKCFYRPYKGLKLFSPDIYSSASVSVFIVPIRG